MMRSLLFKFIQKFLILGFKSLLVRWKHFLVANVVYHHVIIIKVFFNISTKLIIYQFSRQYFDELIFVRLNLLFFIFFILKILKDTKRKYFLVVLEVPIDSFTATFFQALTHFSINFVSFVTFFLNLLRKICLRYLLYMLWHHLWILILNDF